MTDKRTMVASIAVALVLLGAIVAFRVFWMLPARDWEATTEFPTPFEAARFREHVAYLAGDDLAGRYPGSEGSAKAGEYVVRHFREAGLSPPATQSDFSQTFPWNGGTARNLVGVLAGSGELADQAVLVLAHYDHLGTDPKRLAAHQDGIFNGADDGASGVSALLLLAEALRKKHAELGSPRRSVVFLALDCQEPGCLGSRHYCQRPCWPLEKTSAVMNLDWVGRVRRGRVYASDAGTSPLIEERLAALGEQCRLLVETRLSGLRRADHMVFLDRRIPAFTLSTDQHVDSHQVTDEASKIDADGGARIAWLAWRLLAEMIVHPQPIPFRSPNRDVAWGALGRAVGPLGIVPGPYKPGSGGFPKIVLVWPGSAAERAGVRPGDQVAAVSGVSVDRVEDMLHLWGQWPFADGIRFSLLRQGKKVDATLPADAIEGLFGPKPRPVDGGLYEVTFRYRPAKPPKSVHLAGSFNEWSQTAEKMEGPDKEGRFTKRLELPDGLHEYKFVVDGATWEPDPENVLRTGFYQNSLLLVGVRP